MRYKLLVLLWLVPVSGAVAGSAAPTAAVEELAASGSTEISFDLGGKPVGVWSGGALIVVDDPRSAAPVVRAFDRSGRPVTQLRFTIPGADLIAIRSGQFSRGLDGSLAVAGSAYTSDSRAASFLAWISSDGRQQIVVRVDPFAPYVVAVASDGTIWAAGRELVDGQELHPGHHIVRRYDKTGKMLGSWIPRSSLNVNPGFTHPVVYSHLVSSKDRVGWYSEASQTYVEFALDGTVLGRFDTAKPGEGTTQPGVALCDDGGLFRSVAFHHDSTGAKRWGIFSLDRQRGVWTFLPGSGKWGMLYGCEGGSLASTTSGRTITWLEKVK